MNIEVKSVGRANLIGAIWMVGSMGAFAIEDALVKAVAGFLPLGQILMLFGSGGALVFAAVAARNGDRFLGPAIQAPSMRFRMLFEIAGRLFYAMAIVLTPLSATTVILQATPLVVVAGAAFVLGETVGLRRWLAVLVGLIGVVIVVGPGRDSFSILSMLAVGGLLGFAGRDLTSRVAPASVSTAILGLYGFVSVFFAGALIALWQTKPFVIPDSIIALCLVGAVCVGVIAYACLMKAMRTGEVSAVTPFRYSRLLFGIGLGVYWFGEALNLQIVIGSSLIVASGLIIVGRRRLPSPPGKDLDEIDAMSYSGQSNR